MHTYDKNGTYFRAIYLVFAVAVLVISAVSLYRYASSPTDENAFRTSPSDVYTTHSLPGRMLDFPEENENNSPPDSLPDSVRVGDLLLSINNKIVTTPDKIQRYLGTLEGGQDIELTIFRPDIAQEITYIVVPESIHDSTFRKIPSSVFVLNVTEGGASDRAGLQVGDLIYRINDQPFKDEFEAAQILQFAQSGNSIAYEIIRDNQNITLQITLASVGIRLSVLMLMLCGFVYMSTGIFVALRRPQFKAARLIGWSFLIIGFFMTVLIPSLSGRSALQDVFTIFRDMLTITAIFLSFPLWLHMIHYFPMERIELLKRRWVRVGAYILAGCFFLLMLFTQSIAVFLTALLSMSFYNLLVPWFFRKERSEEYEKLNRIIFRTSLFVFVIIIAFIIAVFVLMPPQGWGETSGSEFVIEFFRGFIGIPLVLIPLSFLFTIGHYRLLDLDLRVRRNVQYNIVSSLWVIGVAALLVKMLFFLPELNLDMPNVQFKGTFIEVIDEPLTTEDRILMEKIMVIFLAIGAFWLIWKVRRAGQRFIDQKFDRGQYDYRKAASELAEVMAAQITMESLANGIIQKLAALMQVKQVGVMFFREEKICCCSDIFGMDKPSWDVFTDKIKTRIVNIIQTNRSDYRFSVEYLPTDIQNTFKEYGFKHIIAIRSKDKLVGILLIGEKRSESPFHKDDLVFLAAVAKQASVAIENTFLYEELAEQERLKHELEIARRIQLASLPQTTPHVQGLDIAGISIPALEVGGDYFDYLNKVPNEITIIVGDVSGKGTSAALYMSKAQGIMRSLYDFGLSPRELFIRANQLLSRDLEKQSFITAVGAAFQPARSRVVFARAGHIPLYYFQARNGKVHMLTPGGIGLGLTADERFADSLQEEELPYEPGDIFLFITDGITEAHSRSGQEFGDEQILQLLVNANGAGAKRIRDQIITAVNHFAEDAQQHDDLTVVVVKAV